MWFSEGFSFFLGGFDALILNVSVASMTSLTMASAKWQFSFPGEGDNTVTLNTTVSSAFVGLPRSSVVSPHALPFVEVAEQLRASP